MDGRMRCVVCSRSSLATLDVCTIPLPHSFPPRPLGGWPCGWNRFCYQLLLLLINTHYLILFITIYLYVLLFIIIHDYLSFFISIGVIYHYLLVLVLFVVIAIIFAILPSFIILHNRCVGAGCICEGGRGVVCARTPIRKASFDRNDREVVRMLGASVSYKCTPRVVTAEWCKQSWYDKACFEKHVPLLSRTVLLAKMPKSGREHSYGAMCNMLVLENRDFLRDVMRGWCVNVNVVGRRNVEWPKGRAYKFA